MTAVITQTDLDRYLVGTGMVPCRSILHEREGAPTHEAHWYAHAPCGNVTTVCHERRRWCRTLGGWTCIRVNGIGCTAWQPYDHITFTLI